MAKQAPGMANIVETEGNIFQPLRAVCQLSGLLHKSQTMAEPTKLSGISSKLTEKKREPTTAPNFTGKHENRNLRRVR
jgi:hypothetical protein